MTGAELKEALLKQTPVIAHIRDAGDVLFPRIYEIVYRRSEYRDRGRISLSVGLIDKNGNCIVHVRARDVRSAEAEAEKNTADAGTSTVN